LKFETYFKVFILLSSRASRNITYLILNLVGGGG